MKQYWLRIIGAWLLLKFATNLVRDAEKLLAETAKGEHLPAPTTVTVTEYTETWIEPEASQNGHVEEGAHVDG